jgi:hypothetical protein
VSMELPLIRPEAQLLVARCRDGSPRGSRDLCGLRPPNKEHARSRVEENKSMVTGLILSPSGRTRLRMCAIKKTMPTHI